MHENLVAHLVPRSSDKSKIGNNNDFALGSGRDGGNCSNLESLTYIQEYKQGLKLWRHKTD